MRSYAHVTLYGHVAGKARKLRSAARFRLRFLSYAHPWSKSGDEVVIPVFAFGRAADIAFDAAVNTPVLVSGRLVRRQVTCIETNEIVVCGEPASAGPRERRGPTEEQHVIRHQRVLPDGRTIWVKAHTRPPRLPGATKHQRARNARPDKSERTSG